MLFLQGVTLNTTELLTLSMHSPQFQHILMKTAFNFFNQNSETIHTQKIFSNIKIYNNTTD